MGGIFAQKRENGRKNPNGFLPGFFASVGPSKAGPWSGRLGPGLARLRMARPGQAKPGKTKPGQAWPCLARPVLAWHCEAKPDLAWPGLARPGHT